MPTPKRLHSLKATEVSLVGKGANQKQFVVLKEDVEKDVLSADGRKHIAPSNFVFPKDKRYPIHDLAHARNALARSSGKPEEGKVRSAVYRKYPQLKKKDDVTKDAGQPSLLEKITRVIKTFGQKPENDAENPLAELTPAAQTAVKAVGRILAPHKDEITDAHIDAIQSEVGIPSESGEHEDDDSEGGSVKPEHMKQAMKKADDAMREELKKLGYAKYPEGTLTMKAKPKDTSEEDDEEEEEEEGEGNVSKQAPQAILKEDGSLNLDAVPAEMRPIVEVIHKAQMASETRAKAAETRAEALEKVLKENTENVRKSEIVRKSAEFKHLNAEDVAKTLQMADKVSKEEYERVVKMFEAQNAQIGESKLFTQLGSSHENISGGSSDIIAKMDAKISAIVQKSATPITKEQATADFLETAEGQQMYAMHQASRKDGI